jgi:hypothetical protein
VHPPRRLEPRARGHEVRIVERGGQRAGEPRPRPRVGVERDDDRAARRLEPLLQRPRLPDPARARLNCDHPRAVRPRDVRGAVARAVVGHDHLEHVRIARQAREAGPDPRRLVARRDHHRDPPLSTGRRSQWGPPAPPAGEPRDRDPGGRGLGEREQHPTAMVAEPGALGSA